MIFDYIRHTYWHCEALLIDTHFVIMVSVFFFIWGLDKLRTWWFLSILTYRIFFYFSKVSQELLYLAFWNFVYWLVLTSCAKQFQLSGSYSCLYWAIFLSLHTKKFITDFSLTTKAEEIVRGLQYCEKGNQVYFSFSSFSPL